MSLDIQKVTHPTQDIEVEQVTIVTADDLRELRASDWHEGQLALLTYPTADPVGFIGIDNLKAGMGRIVSCAGEAHRVTGVPVSAFGPYRKVEHAPFEGTTLRKGPAGDFEVEL